MKARAKWLEDRRVELIAGHRDPSVPAGKGYMVNGTVNGYHGNGDIKKLKCLDVSFLLCVIVVVGAIWRKSGKK